MGIYKVQSDGNAPAGLSIGDQVVTGGGTYTIVKDGTEGSTYNKKTGYSSVLTDKNQTTDNYNGPYDTLGSSSSSSNADYQAMLDEIEAGYDEGMDEIDDMRDQLEDYAESAGYEFDEAFWEELMSDTQGSYDDYLKKMQEAYASQLKMTTNELEGQKGKVNNSYQDLYDQLYIEKMNRERNLGQVLKAQGISGGMTESSALRLSNEYQSALAKAESERIGKISDIDTAISNAKLTSQNSQSQVEAEIMQAASTAIQNLELQMRNDQLTVRQLNEAREQWALQMQMSITQWEQQYQQAADSMKLQVAQMAHDDLLAKAQTLSAYGDFSGYAALGYSQAEINSMTAAYTQMLQGSSSGGGSYSYPGGGDDEDDEIARLRAQIDAQLAADAAGQEQSRQNAVMQELWAYYEPLSILGDKAEIENRLMMAAFRNGYTADDVRMFLNRING